jgi:serine/threonine protein phosphatase PrpC
VRSALLRGREHGALGAVEAIAEAGLAIALSRGGAPKRYAHDEPNEDAAAFALGAAGACIGVADGHGGAEAAEIALLHLFGEPAEQWTDAPGPLAAERWRRQVLAALSDANRDVRRERRPREGNGARTTLALALALPQRGLLLGAAVGDSHLFVADRDGVREPAASSGAVGFLGDAHAGAEALAGVTRIVCEPLAGLRAAVLATDGLSERGIGVISPAAAVKEAVRSAERRRAGSQALSLARDLVDAAIEAHRRNRAGDNVAVAVLWLDELDTIPL